MANLKKPAFVSPTTLPEDSVEFFSWLHSLSMDEQREFLLSEAVSSEVLFMLVKPENYLARSGSQTDFFQQTIATRSSNPLRVWFVLATQSTKKTLSLMSQNQYTPPHILDRLKYRKDEEIILGLAKNSSSSWQTLQDMIAGLKIHQHKKVYVLAVENILRREDLSSQQLSSMVELMFSEKKIVPTFANGWRFNEPLTTLSLLLASSHTLPTVVVDNLFELAVPRFSDIIENNDLWYVSFVEKILRHPNLGSESFHSTFSFLDTLNPVLNDYTWVLSALLMNPSCPIEFLEKYCMSGSIYLRSIAARHASCPEHARVLAALS